MFLLSFYLILSFFTHTSSIAADELFHLPQADEQGIVRNSKVLTIKGPKFPFNASIVTNKKGGYWLFFREDLQGRTLDFPSGARIGIVPLNNRFEQTGEAIFPPYPTLGRCVEDPRAFWISDELYTLYYVYPRPNPVCPCLIKVDPTTLQPIHIQFLKNESCPEKNWVPLIKPIASDTLICVRTLYPQDLVRINMRSKNIQFVGPKEGLKMSAPKTWKWGSLSGGTHAELIDGQFLSFFHSWFLAKNGKRIYVMGACTFDATYPHQLRAISPCPILFKNLYTARAQNKIGDIFSRKWASHIEKVIFPCGFVTKKKASGQTLIHLSCGENDNSIRIITLDKDKLLQSLIPVQ